MHRIAPHLTATSILAFAVCLGFSSLHATGAWARSASQTLGDLDNKQLDRRAHHDVSTLRSYVAGVARLKSRLQKEDVLWTRDEKTTLSPAERRRVLELFEQVLAFEVGLDQLSSFHANFWRVPLLTDRARHGRHFAIGYAAYLQQIELGLVFIERTLGKPQFEKLLDEGNRRFGIPPGAYGRLKWNVVHLLDVSRVIAAAQYNTFLGAAAYSKLRKLEKKAGRVSDVDFVLNVVDSTYPPVRDRLKGKGVGLFAGNGFDILKDTGHSAWFPVQAEVAEWMGDTKVHRIEEALIDEKQIAAATIRSRPGDIIIERRNWYLSNVGLPGFWPHAALWLGSPKELAAYLDNDPETLAVYGAPFTSVLRKKYPRTWATYSSSDTFDHDHRVLEAMSEGVVFSTAEHSLAADYAAALRPRTTKIEIAKAIERAFRYHGRPYDFDFDFFTDASLVCSELVFKAYEPRVDVTGVHFALERIMGRMTLPPNTMVRQYDEAAGTANQQLDLVWFLDGRERSSTAIWGTEASFRSSWQRPKWDIAQR